MVHAGCSTPDRAWLTSPRAPTRLPPTTARRASTTRFCDTFEAGIALTGTEVKSLRGGKATIGEAYAGPSGEEIFLFNAYIPEYLQANRFNHETQAGRVKLLLHKRQINKLIGATQREGFTVVPLEDLLQRAGPGEGGAGARPRQEAARQARDREAARLGTGSARA